MPSPTSSDLPNTVFEPLVRISFAGGVQLSYLSPPQFGLIPDGVYEIVSAHVEIDIGRRGILRHSADLILSHNFRHSLWRRTCALSTTRLAAVDP